MSKTFHIKGKAPKKRNQVVREMIVEGIGRSQVMKDKRDKRTNNPGRDWRSEDWG